MMELAWIFTTMHPIDFAEEMARFRFSDFWKMFRGWLLLIAISGMVPGTATLMNLLNKRGEYQRRTPSMIASKIDFSLMGMRFLRSTSF